MKTNPVILNVIALGIAALTLPALAPQASAQAPVEGAPPFVDYQGLVFDGTTGNPLGSTGAGTVGDPYVAAPENFTIEFRIYDALSAGNLVWSEKQTVTVSKGNFSVRLGLGAPLVPPAPIASIINAFNGADRYLELTVGVAGTAISPRLAFQSSPFAFTAQRASLADSIVDDQVNGAKIANGTITSADIASNTVTGSNILNSTITGADIAGNTVSGFNILNSTITSADILDGQVFGSDIANFTITSSDIASNTITGSNILNFTITSSDIASNTVTGSNILNGTITASDMSSSYDSALWFDDGTSSTTYTFDSVGIGTSTVTGAKLTVSGHKNTTVNGAFRYINPGATGTSTNRFGSWSIYASAEIRAGGQISSFSDERIKRIEGVSNGERDLSTLLGIEITDYTYIDTLDKGTNEQKKVIAQQVEEVFPQAVSLSTDVVPDIYQKAKVMDGWVQLATSLKKGERVRLIGLKIEGIHEVLEVEQGKFRTDFAADCDEVFVFGREVDDFRSVEYDAIAMLNVSATQQIKKEKDAEVASLREENSAMRSRLAELEAAGKARDAEVAAQREENSAMRARLAELEAADKARDAKLASIEALLQSVGKSDTRLVSLIHAGDVVEK